MGNNSSNLLRPNFSNKVACQNKTNTLKHETFWFLISSSAYKYAIKDEELKCNNILEVLLYILTHIR